MEQELMRLRQQIEIERNIHAAALEYISRVTSGLQEQTVGWGTRRDEDLHSKETYIEVSSPVG
jgi:hypothetical protein